MLATRSELHDAAKVHFQCQLLPGEHQMIANGVMLDSPGRSEAEALGYRVAAMQAPKISAYLDA